MHATNDTSIHIPIPIQHIQIITHINPNKLHRYNLPMSKLHCTGVRQPRTQYKNKYADSSGIAIGNG